MPVTAALSTSRAIREVIMPGLVVILVVVMVIVEPIFTMVIVAALVVSGAGSPFGFFGVGISVCYLYQFIDGCGPLVVHLAIELLMPEPFGESSDGLGVGDVGNRISCL